MSTEINDPHPYEQHLLTLALLLICLFLVYTQAAKRLDLLAYDTVVNASPTPINEQVVIVSIDERSLNGIGQWPWRRAIHAQLIDKLSSYNTSLIAFDIIFSEPDTQHPGDDEILAKSMRDNGNTLLPMHIHPLSYGQALTEILPIPELITAAKKLGHVHVELDEDGLARGIFLKSGVGSDHWPSLSMAMATEINPMIQYIKEAEDRIKAPYISVNTEFRLIPFAGPRGTYPTYSYLDVMSDKIPADAFRNKVVMIGATAAGLGDIIPTPITNENSPMSGVELHANAFSAIMSNTAIRPVIPLWIYLLTFAFIMIPIVVFPRLKPTYVMPSAIVMVCMVMGFSYALMRYDHSWFPPINSMIGILLAYPLWSWQRMRHLNSFFSQELERLNQEPDLGFRKIGQHNIEKIFLSLLSLLQPRQYVFIKDNHLLHSFDKESLNSIKLLREGLWKHDEHASWIKIRHHNTSYKIGLGWDASTSRKNICDFLDKLDLSAQLDVAPTRYYEQIANRIAQVREAISAMQDMRTFISKGFEEMPGAVLVTDPAGIVVFSNSHAMKWLNKGPKELHSQAIHEVFAEHMLDQDKISEGIAAVLLQGKHSEFQIQINNRDVLIHCLPFLVDENSDAGLMISMSDITAIKQQQREKNQLIDFLSHDVRSPLVSQLAMLQGIRSGRIEWQTELIGDIESHAKRSLNLSDQFLQITRAEQTTEGDFYEFELLSAIENSVDSIIQLAKSKHITIVVKSDDMAEGESDDKQCLDELWIKGNAELVERAIINLLSNAIKYSDPNTNIRVELVRQNDTARIKVIDQGHGIAQDELPHIFERFRRQRQSELSGNKGAGLGLNFVDVVATKHNGAVFVDSRLGHGTTFTLEFPIHS